MREQVLHMVAVAIKHGQGTTVDIPTGFDILALLNMVYTAAGMVAVVAIVLGGIFYTTADGDSSKIQRAKNSIVYSVVGLIVVILAASITNFILGQFK